MCLGMLELLELATVIVRRFLGVANSQPFRLCYWIWLGESLLTNVVCNIRWTGALNYWIACCIACHSTLGRFHLPITELPWTGAMFTLHNYMHLITPPVSFSSWDRMLYHLPLLCRFCLASWIHNFSFVFSTLTSYSNTHYVYTIASVYRAIFSIH